MAIGRRSQRNFRAERTAGACAIVDDELLAETRREPGGNQASDDVGAARERVRWFPALVSNHVVDLINKYEKADLPEALWHYVENREGYDYLHHAEVGSDNASFVSDQIVDRFAIVGPAEAHQQRLEELRAAGVTQFNIYLMNGDEEAQLDAYGAEIVSELAPAG